MARPMTAPTAQIDTWSSIQLVSRIARSQVDFL
jgi:hypothetical protein